MTSEEVIKALELHIARIQTDAMYMRRALMHMVGNPRYAEFGGLTEKEIAYKVMGDSLMIKTVI